MQLKRSRLAIVLLLLTGCAGLIGVPDLTLQEEPDEAGALDGSNNITNDGQTRLDGTSNSDTSTPGTDAGTDSQPTSDGGTDSATCDLSKTVSDPQNCGSCGHTCLDDAGCSQGTCGAVYLTTLEGNVGLTEMIENDKFIYGLSEFADADEQGVYRIDKVTGKHSLYAPLRHAQKLVIVGDTLWITAYETKYDSDDPIFSNGGLYRCKLVAGDTCTVELIEPVSYPEGMVAIGTNLYFADYGRTEFRKLDTTVPLIADGGTDAEVAITKYGGATEIGVLYDMFVDPSTGVGNVPTTYFLDEYVDSVVAYKLNAAGLSAASIGSYQKSPNGVFNGSMVGNATSVYWTGADYFPELGGAIKRVNRADDTSCDLGNRAAGANQVIRPQGIYLDSKNVFWSNRGEWDPAYDKGSIVMCPIDTCCPDATFVWKGTGQPWGLVGDTTRLYWSVYQSGDIYRTTKP